MWGDKFKRGRAKMPDSFYIQNPWTGLVIDIGENSQRPQPGTALRANAKQTSAPGNTYQLWTFAPSNEAPVKTVLNYFFLQNANSAYPFVIDIEEQGNVITKSPGGQTIRAGSRLDAYTVKSGQFGDLDDNHPASSNQLWGFVQDRELGPLFHPELADQLRHRHRGRTQRCPTGGKSLSRCLAAEDRSSKK